MININAVIQNNSGFEYIIVRILIDPFIIARIPPDKKSTKLYPISIFCKPNSDECTSLSSVTKAFAVCSRSIL